MIRDFQKKMIPSMFQNFVTEELVMEGFHVLSID